MKGSRKDMKDGRKTSRQVTLTEREGRKEGKGREEGRKEGKGREEGRKER